MYIKKYISMFFIISFSHTAHGQARNFRKLPHIRAFGSAQFDGLDLFEAKNSLKKDPLTVIDLRKESHRVKTNSCKKELFCTKSSPNKNQKASRKKNCHTSGCYLHSYSST